MKFNNKGFSMVEIIFVIAIMAIASAALAPQLMKYVGRSRESTDINSCESIKTSVNAAMANNEEYVTINNGGVEEKCSIWDRISSVGYEFKIYIRKSDSGDDVLVQGIWEDHPIITELKSTLKGLENPKVAGMNSYEIIITADDVEFADGDDTYHTYTTEKIEVFTSTYKFSTNSDTPIPAN